jgi:antitoxin component YwqK of YwqJK toxin-antitoxin module
MINLGKVETVTDRYPNGKVRIEREVGLDAKGNYVNQGPYKTYDPDGQLIKAGDFINGRQDGKWTQRLAKDEGRLFSNGDGAGFQGPFTSEATFLDGRLHGIWTIKDRDGKNIVEWGFDQGVRNGTWTWWHPNGRKRRDAIYTNGVLNGEVQEWDREGKVTSHTTYLEGRSQVPAVGWYAPGQKHYEGYFLRADANAEQNFDWWNSRTTAAPARPAVPDQKHGTWVSWYKNGMTEATGQYDQGLPDGKFSWWYESGQRQAEGEYEKGKRTGVWTTWHANGLKASMAEYRNGQLVGRVTQWDAEGKLEEANSAGPRVVSQPARTASQSDRSGTVRKPTPGMRSR